MRLNCSFRLLSIVISLAMSSTLTAHGQDPAADYTRIREGMNKLSPFVGKWSAVALFHDDDGITENDGTWDIRWMCSAIISSEQTKSLKTRTLEGG